MKTTTAYDFGDVVLVAFPFTDQSTTKMRPAVVVSSKRFHKSYPDLIIMAITSQVERRTRGGDAAIQFWREAGLLKPSVLKPVITTIEETLVRRKLGSLAAEDMNSLRGTLERSLGR